MKARNIPYKYRNVRYNTPMKHRYSGVNKNTALLIIVITCIVVLSVIVSALVITGRFNS